MIIKLIPRDFDTQEAALLASYFTELKGNDVYKKVFTEGSAETFGQFISEVVMTSHFYLIVDPSKSRVMAHFHLNNFEGETLQLHFHIFKDYRQVSKELGQLAVEHIWSSYETLKSIIGIIPKSNTLAVNYVKGLGFDRVDTVPGLIPNVYKNEIEDGAILRLSRWHKA